MTTYTKDEIDSKFDELSTQFTDSISGFSGVSPYVYDAPFNQGATAWMLTSCALVLFMSIPGLALYYGGMVRTKNILACIMQVMSITCLITFLWLCFGYSLSFGPVNTNDMNETYCVSYAGSDCGKATKGQLDPFLGDASRFWFVGMTNLSHHNNAAFIPETVFCLFQLTFAIITASLICGSFADRMKYSSMLVFMGLWHLIVYCPIAHWNWHPNGFLFTAGIMDFAGGNVVHIASGMSGLASVIIIGNRKGFGKQRFEPHNILYTVVGTSMLWVGWFGFNGGSAGQANGRAGMACLVTHIAAGVAGFTWMLTDWMMVGKPSVLGMVNGVVAGLVCITPGSGFVDPTGAFFYGLFSGPVCYFGAQLKHKLGFDDALDAFGVHAIGGILGGILTAFFASNDVTTPYAAKLYPTNGILYQDETEGPLSGGGPTARARLLGLQIYGIVVTAGWSFIMSLAILKAVDLTMGLRVSELDEDDGLDNSMHGETLEAKEIELVSAQEE